MSRRTEPTRISSARAKPPSRCRSGSTTSMGEKDRVRGMRPPRATRRVRTRRLPCARRRLPHIRGDLEGRRSDDLHAPESDVRASISVGVLRGTSRRTGPARTSSALDTRQSPCRFASTISNEKRRACAIAGRWRAMAQGSSGDRASERVNARNEDRRRQLCGRLHPGIVVNLCR